MSALYAAPVLCAGGELKATAFAEGERGPICRERFGFIKKDWQPVGMLPALPEHPATAAFDEQPDTYWAADASSVPVVFTVDLGETQSVSGFAYTPPTDGKHNLISEGRIEASSDGKQWQSAGSFQFGNLVNDPTRRFHDFARPLEGRYFRLVVTGIEGGKDSVALAELDLF